MDFIIYIAKSSGILTLFYLVYAFVLEKDTFFLANRIFLLIGIVTALLLPFATFTTEIFIETPTMNFASDFSEQTIINQIEPGLMEEPFNFWQVLLTIYFIGFGILVMRFLIQLASLLHLLHNNPSKRVSGFRFVTIDAQIAPFSFFNYIVFNPVNHEQDELKMILLHEKVHASRWHSADIILSILIRTLQWVNPISWLYKRSVEANLEFLADHKSVSNISSKIKYQLALLRASSPYSAPALTNNFYHSFIKKRIIMLNKSTSKKINTWKLSIILPFLAVFLFSFNVKEVLVYPETASDLGSTVTKSFSASEAINETPVEGKNETNPETPSEKTALSRSTKTEEDKVLPKVSITNVYSSEKINSPTNKRMTVQDILLTITKNATKSELEAMKSDLKSNGFGFNYSNLEYNDSNEIIGIAITYIDKNGNSGNYSVNSDSPINTIVIKASGNQISMRSASSGEYSISSDVEEEVVRASAKERREHMKEQEIEMEERRAKMRKEMEERRAKMHKEMEEMRKEMEERGAQIRSKKDSTFFRSHGTRDSNGLFEKLRMHHDSTRTSILDRPGVRKDRIRARSHSSIPMENLKRITKDASETDLDRLKSEFENEGVSFSYSSIKRNELGEIIKIKVKLDNNNGAISSSSYNNNGLPIKTILLGSENGTTVMTSSPN